jgi:DNA-binding NarL/FixJ family response regulator
MIMIRVYIVDDHYIVIEGLKSLLLSEKDIEVVGDAMNADDCLRYFLLNKADIILMDINMPGKDGVQLCKEIKTLYPDVMVLALSTYNQDSYIRQMMDNGASGYILKNTDKEELIEAIHAIYRGRTFLSFEVSQVIKSQTQQNSQLPILTRREKEVLALVADGLTTLEIAQKLYISETTVNSHRRNLLDKINAKNTAALIRFAIDNKLV